MAPGIRPPFVGTFVQESCEYGARVGLQLLMGVFVAVVLVVVVAAAVVVGWLLMKMMAMMLVRML